MEPFVVPKEHIHLLVTPLVLLPEGVAPTPASLSSLLSLQSSIRNIASAKDCPLPDAVGAILLEQNILSVRAYRGVDCVLPDWVRGGYRYVLLSFRPSVVELLKALEYYEQQSSYGGWHGSKAHCIVQQLRSYLLAFLPGYALAPCCWDSRSLRRRSNTARCT